MRKTTRVAWVLALTGALALGACADTTTRPMPPPLTSRAPQSGESPDATPDSSAAPAADELASGSARHDVRSNGLSVRVGYGTQVPARWAGEAGTALQLTVSARDSRASSSKVYLSRATLTYVADDGVTALPAPDPVVDGSNINPGYLVTSPNEYVQVFGVPPVDRTARNLTLVVKLEFVTLVDKKAKDYTKRTVTDRVRTVVG